MARGTTQEKEHQSLTKPCKKRKAEAREEAPKAGTQRGTLQPAATEGRNVTPAGKKREMGKLDDGR
jgi:hypothetical protein